MSKENNDKECRICFDNESIDDPLITPCKCKGTSAFVHKSCLKQWRMFNKGKPGWKKCMECNENYAISKKYPVEKFIYEITFLPGIYFFESITASIGSFLFWSIEYNTDYLLVKILNFDNKILNKRIIKDLEDNILFPQVLYYDFTFLLIGFIFHIYFYYKYCSKIKRKKTYWEEIKLKFIFSLIFNLNFLYIYYIFSFSHLEILFYNFTTVLTFIIPYNHYRMLKLHNKTVQKMNIENEEEVLSFSLNPLINDNIELRNIIIR